LLGENHWGSLRRGDHGLKADPEAVCEAVRAWPAALANHAFRPS
jgi:hypothetical protein